MIKTGVLCLVVVAGGFRGLLAQEALAIGQRVRLTSVRHGLKRVTGRVLAATSDSLRVDMDRGDGRDTLAVALGDLDRLELGYVSGHRTRRGARIGFVAGAVIGYAIGAAQYHKCVPQGWFDCLWAIDSRAEDGIVGAVAGGVIGAAVGGLVGSLTRAVKWAEVRPL